MTYCFSTPMDKLPSGMIHRTFFSRLAGHEVGCVVYLPAEYENSTKAYPVFYHLHGWQNNENTELAAMESVCRGREAITVIPNWSLPVDHLESFPLERMILDELLPQMEHDYRILSFPEHRGISGFSMGGGMAFCYAVKHPDLFGSVTAYAGTYHHYFGQGFLTVGADAQRAEEFRQIILNAASVCPQNILRLLQRQANLIRGRLQIEMRVGTKDVLYCDNEIMHLHLTELKIPHTYLTIDGAAHELKRIV